LGTTFSLKFLPNNKIGPFFKCFISIFISTVPGNSTQSSNDPFGTVKTKISTGTSQGFAQFITNSKIVTFSSNYDLSYTYQSFNTYAGFKISGNLKINYVDSSNIYELFRLTSGTLAMYLNTYSLEAMQIFALA
jgi:hypothetical protein